MAKVYYVVENGPDYSRVSFFKTEKEALEEGLSNIPNFEMGEEPMNDEENDGDDFYHGDELTFKKGILYTVESGEVVVEAIDEDDAKEKVQENEDCVAIFFDGFTKGMYGYQGTAADGTGYKWDWDGYDINESNTLNTKHKMKHIKLFEAFVNEKKKWSDIDSYNIGDEFMYEFPKNRDWEDSMWSSLEDWMDQEWGPNAGVESSKGFEDALEEVTDYLKGEGYSV